MTQTPNLLNILSPNNIIIYMLIFTRLTGMMQRAPFFSTISAPMLTKVWFSATIAFLIYPIVYVQKYFIVPHNMPELAILILIEFFIGYLIGYIAEMIIQGVQVTGSILSIQMGLSMSQALDPVTGIQSTELSRIYVFLATLLFIGTGAYQMLFTTVFSSFQAIPMGAVPVFDANVVMTCCQLFSSMFRIGMGIALPVFAVLLTSDVLLGMMSKMMPQMNIYMVALPVKIYIGLFLTLAFLSAVTVFLQGVISNYMEVLSKIFT